VPWPAAGYGHVPQADQVAVRPKARIRAARARAVALSNPHSSALSPPSVPSWS